MNLFAIPFGTHLELDLVYILAILFGVHLALDLAYILFKWSLLLKRARFEDRLKAIGVTRFEFVRYGTRKERMEFWFDQKLLEICPLSVSQDWSARVVGIQTCGLFQYVWDKYDWEVVCMVVGRFAEEEKMAECIVGQPRDLQDMLGYYDKARRYIVTLASQKDCEGYIVEAREILTAFEGDILEARDTHSV